MQQVVFVEDGRWSNGVHTANNDVPFPSGDVAVQPDGDLPLPADPEEGRRAGGRPHRQRHLPRHVRVPQRSRGGSSCSNFIAARNMQMC